MNSKLEYLKQQLKKNNTVCAIENKSGIHVSSSKGITPVIQWLEKDKDFLKDSFIADKVIGKAVALLMVYSGVKSVYAAIISKPALTCFKDNNIDINYDILVDNIKNRTGTDMCPMERKCLHIDNPKIAYEVLSNLIKQKF